MFCCYLLLLSIYWTLISAPEHRLCRGSGHRLFFVPVSLEAWVCFFDRHFVFTALKTINQFILFLLSHRTLAFCWVCSLIVSWYRFLEYGDHILWTSDLLLSTFISSHQNRLNSGGTYMLLCFEAFLLSYQNCHRWLYYLTPSEVSTSLSDSFHRCWSAWISIHSCKPREWLVHGCLMICFLDVTKMPRIYKQFKDEPTGFGGTHTMALIFSVTRSTSLRNISNAVVLALTVIWDVQRTKV